MTLCLEFLLPFSFFKSLFPFWPGEREVVTYKIPRPSKIYNTDGPDGPDGSTEYRRECMRPPCHISVQTAAKTIVDLSV